VAPSSAARPRQPSRDDSEHARFQYHRRATGRRAVGAFLKRRAPGRYAPWRARADEFRVLATMPGDARPRDRDSGHGSPPRFRTWRRACATSAWPRGGSSRGGGGARQTGDMSSPACEHVVGLDGWHHREQEQRRIVAERGQIAKIFTARSRIGKTRSAPGRSRCWRAMISPHYDTFKLCSGKRQLVAGACARGQPGALRPRCQRPRRDRLHRPAYVRSAKAVAVSEAGTGPDAEPLDVATEDYRCRGALLLHRGVAQSWRAGLWSSLWAGWTGHRRQIGFVELNVKAESAAAAQRSSRIQTRDRGAERLRELPFRPAATLWTTSAGGPGSRGGLPLQSRQSRAGSSCAVCRLRWMSDTNARSSVSRAAWWRTSSGRGHDPAAVSGSGRPAGCVERYRDGRREPGVEVWLRTM